MRYHEISNSFRVPISDEEQYLLNKIGKFKFEDELNEREINLAHSMLIRGHLKKIYKDKKSAYVDDSISNIWLERN